MFFAREAGSTSGKLPWSQAAITADKYRCHVLLKEKISVSLEMTRGAKIARLQPPLSVKLSRVLLCEACVMGGGPTWTDITVSHLLLCILTLAQA